MVLILLGYLALGYAITLSWLIYCWETLMASCAPAAAPSRASKTFVAIASLFVLPLVYPLYSGVLWQAFLRQRSCNQLRKYGVQLFRYAEMSDEQLCA